MKNPPPLTSYTVMRQLRLAGSLEEYQEVLRDFHRRYRDEAERALSDHEREKVDILMKTAQVTRGSLNQFLSTPIKSDNEEVQRIIREGLEKFSEQTLPSRAAAPASWETRILTEHFADVRDPMMKKLLTGGKRRLRRGGFMFARDSGPIFESVFIAGGALSLNEIDSLLKGVPEEDDEDASARSVRAERAMHEFKDGIAAVGDLTPTPGVWEADIMFEAPRLEALRERCDLICKTLTKEFNIHHISFWEKKFSSTKKNSINLLVRMIPDFKHLGEIVKRISTHDDHELVVQILSGALIIKEVVG